jgi:hypothetical protein
MSTTIPPAASAPESLRAEVGQIDHDCPGWHAWVSSTGRVNATCCKSSYGGSGTTLDAPTAEQMRHAIAEQEHEWEVAA